MNTKSYRDEIVARVYKRYQELLVANNAVDFDDLLLWTWRLLEENPPVREEYARRFEYVLVDEFQDTNLAQYELLRHLASYHQNFFVVGDEDQSIYRWRGADYRNVLRFEEDYPKARKDPARAKLPLHPDRAGCRHRCDRPQPPPHAQAPALAARPGDG